MSLKDDLHTDLTAAIKERDQVRTATLRMTLASVMNAEVAGKSARTLSDDEVLAVITKEAKKRREAAEAYDGAGRTELADNERAELAVLETYLPAQLGDAEIKQLIGEVMEETGASGMKDMGTVMKILQPRIAGRADGGKVAGLVRAQLGA